MSQLEQDYPDVQFVYMTGHLDGTGIEGNLNQRNEQIRSYCRNNDKVLYDFADIESYDPDGEVNFMGLYANDNCDYGSGVRENWAVLWQNSHTENVDWYDCNCAHSRPLNGNLKAYAAWYLWARLAGWEGKASGAPKWAKASALGNGWYRSGWYCDFYGYEGENEGWIYSNEHDFQYFGEECTSDSSWFWDCETGKWWWTCEEWYPAVYLHEYGWLYYCDGDAPGRRFYDYVGNAFVYETDL